VKEPVPELVQSLKSNESKMAPFNVDRMGGFHVEAMWKEIVSLKPIPFLEFESACAAFCKCAERADFRAEAGSIFGELFGSDDAEVSVEEVWQHLPTVLMRLRKHKIPIGRAHRLLVAYGRKEQVIDKRRFVALMDALRPYHRQQTNLRKLFEFLDFESYTGSSPENLRALGKQDGVVSLRDLQIHIAAVAREMELVDVTEMEKEWLFGTMSKEYGGEVNWDCFNLIISMWGEYRDASDVLRGVFQALDCSDFGVNKQFPRVPLDEVFECLPDILLELGLPEPDEETLSILTEAVMEEEHTHDGGVWESHLIQKDDDLIEAETFQRALEKWKVQILMMGKIGEAWNMIDQKGGYEEADHLVTVADVLEHFTLIGEIFGIMIKPGMAHDFLNDFPYLELEDEIPREDFESLARRWLSSHQFRHQPNPLVLWRLYEDFTTDDRVLEPYEELVRVAFGSEGRALGLADDSIDDVFLLVEMMEASRHEMMGDDGRATMDEFVCVLEKWQAQRFSKARSYTTWDMAIQ